jgi:outer membrane protein assembly factor BamB
MNMKTQACVAAALLSLSLAISAQSPGWSQWRGSRRDGSVTFSAPAAWPERPTQVWKVKAGTGHGSPVISGSRVYLLSRVGEQEGMTAFDTANGRQVWQQLYDAPYQMNPAATAHGKGPKGTPVVDRGRVYALGISGMLSGFDAATGKVVWRHDFKKEFPVTAPEFGASMSPLVEGDLVIAHVGGPGHGALSAFDRTTGAQKWSWKGDGPAYASPIVATLGGVRQLITQTQSHVVGLSPADGRLLWKIPFTTEYEQNIITPVVAGDLLIYAGLSKPTTAVRIVQEGTGWKPQQVWQNAETPMYMSSPVVSRGVVYGLTHRNRGQFFALDLQSGKTLWTSAPRQAENAALAVTGDLIIATTTEGEIVVLRQGRNAFTVLKKYSVAESPIWAHPAFTTDAIVVKETEALSMWRFGGGA